MSREILDCLKRERDICVKNVIHSQNTAFMFTPALRESFQGQSRIALVINTYDMRQSEVSFQSKQESSEHQHAMQLFFIFKLMVCLGAPGTEGMVSALYVPLL